MSNQLPVAHKVLALRFFVFSAFNSGFLVVAKFHEESRDLEENVVTKFLVCLHSEGFAKQTAALR